MDENMSEDERTNTPGQESAKRMRTDFEGEEISISSNNSESNSNSNDCNEQTASISSDSGLPLSMEGSNDNNTESVSANESENEQQRNAEINEPRLPESGEEDDLDSVLSSSGNFTSSHSTSAENTIIHSTDSESEEEAEVYELLKKDKPKHTWFMTPEILNRQIGYSSKKSHPSLFQQRCYGSLRNVQKLELMYKLDNHEGCVNSLNFSPDGSLLVSGSDDLKVVIWDWRVCKTLMKIDTRHRRNIFQTKFLDLKGPDLHLATCARDGQVYYLQIGQDGRTENKKSGQHKGPCHKLTVLKDQPHIFLSAGEDGVIFNHDIRRSKAQSIIEVRDDGREVALYSIHSHPLKQHEFCVAGRESYVRIYDQRKSRHPLAKFCPYLEGDSKFSKNLHITCAVYNHDGSEILASYNDEDVYLFDTGAPSGQFIHKYSGHRNGATIKGVSFFGPHSEFVMSGSDCGHLFFWEKKTESIVQFLLADDNGVVNCLEPHPQLPFLATSGLDWDVKLWVPSCEEEPNMKELLNTIKENRRSFWNNTGDNSDNQVLWMLWRRLRATRNARNNLEPSSGTGLSVLSLDSSRSDSSSDSWISSHSDDDMDDNPPGCTTS
ncbi:DDB1- and CUL4-associated factor 8 isoform X2 [Rhynchophorus ferrugineus]|uniref:DDB1- and CUL4-associated factor 8 n=1 Tax=Rhynchophorus ferrugineus TaxID=354439 RepID=A0A834IJZ2_RHYFE|nr:hypothetical protein GWI33_005026 [Rhynchophorus ferrugineus]